MDLNIFMQQMNEINYGWMDINNNIHINTMDNLQELYRTSSIEEILTNKVGICFDQVELERYYLSKDYNTSSYAIISPHMVHSFLVLESDDRYIYFEHSSSKNRGIYDFNSKDELLEYTIDCFAKLHNIKNKNKIIQIEYPPLPPNTTFSEIKDMLILQNESRKTK